ncbi:MAG: NifU family protein [Actinomycetota bacterium]|nr:NifU family protein [Actinomycetota bacterium]
MTDNRHAPPPEVAAALHELDDLIQMFAQHHDEDVQEAVVGMLRAVDVLHRGALKRLGAFLDARSLLEEAQVDPHVGLLFELYDAQGDHDERSRAEAAVEGIRRTVEAQGGRIEVVAAEGGVVNVRLLSACESCYGSGATAALRGLVEEALRAELPEFARMDVSSPPQAPPRPAAPEPVLIPVSSVTVRRRAAPPQSGCGSGAGGCSSCR